MGTGTHQITDINIQINVILIDIFLFQKEDNNIMLLRKELICPKNQLQNESAGRAITINIKAKRQEIKNWKDYYRKVPRGLSPIIHQEHADGGK